MTGRRVRVSDHLRNKWCPKCMEKLPKLLLRSHQEIARSAFSGWADAAEKKLRELDLPEEMLLRRCECGYLELDYTVDSGPGADIWVEVGS
jgi:hypothetical protein